MHHLDIMVQAMPDCMLNPKGAKPTNGPRLKQSRIGHYNNIISINSTFNNHVI